MLDKAMLAQHYRKSWKWENRYIYYDPEMERNQLLEQELVETARYAMERNEFRMYFQPQVYLDSGEVAGTEVLVRWVKPDGRIVMPDEFIPVFEQTGFISWRKSAAVCGAGLTRGFVCALFPLTSPGSIWRTSIMRSSSAESWTVIIYRMN